MQKNSQTNLPSETVFKNHAKLIRAVIGHELKHSQALNLLSMQYGYSNWHICKSKISKDTKLSKLPSVEDVVFEHKILEYSMNILREFKPIDKERAQIEKDLVLCTRFVEKYPRLWNRYLNRFYAEHNITDPKERIFLTFRPDTSSNVYDVGSDTVKKLGRIMLATMKAFADKPEELAKHDIYKLDEKGNRVQDFSSDFWRKGRFSQLTNLDADRVVEAKRILANTSKIKQNQTLSASETEELEELMVLSQFKKLASSDKPWRDSGSGKTFYKLTPEQEDIAYEHDHIEERRIRENLKEDLSEEKRGVLSKRLKLPPSGLSKRTMADYGGSDYNRKDFDGHKILFDKTSNGMKSKT